MWTTEELKTLIQNTNTECLALKATRTEKRRRLRFSQQGVNLHQDIIENQEKDLEALDSRIEIANLAIRTLTNELSKTKISESKSRERKNIEASIKDLTTALDNFPSVAVESALKQEITRLIELGYVLDLVGMTSSLSDEDGCFICDLHKRYYENDFCTEKESIRLKNIWDRVVG